ATNDLWTMQVGAYSDANGPFTRMASAFIKIEEGQPRCQNIVLHGLVGQGLASGQGSSPLVEMRWSDDQGRTFTDWRAGPAGAGAGERSGERGVQPPRAERGAAGVLTLIRRGYGGQA